jgi:hypothetical protein
MASPITREIVTQEQVATVEPTSYARTIKVTVAEGVLLTVAESKALRKQLKAAEYAVLNREEPASNPFGDDF